MDEHDTRNQMSLFNMFIINCFFLFEKTKSNLLIKKEITSSINVNTVFFSNLTNSNSSTIILFQVNITEPYPRPFTANQFVNC
jgi:hypothetical protein